MFGGSGSILAMIQSLKNNKDLLKKRKSLKKINKDYSTTSHYFGEVDEKNLTDAINTHRKLSHKFQRYDAIKNTISFIIIIVFILGILFYLLTTR